VQQAAPLRQTQTLPIMHRIAHLSPEKTIINDHEPMPARASFQMEERRILNLGGLLILLLLASTAPVAAIKSYCVDSSGMAGDEAYTVQGFVETEAKPGELLSKPPWELISDCRRGEPDAVITLEFHRQHIVALGRQLPSKAAEPVPDDRSGMEDYHIDAVLCVADAGSEQVFYEVRSPPLNGVNTAQVTNTNAAESPPVMRRDAMYGAFWTLIRDVALVS
jgi:hypothetical protein